MRWIVLLLIGAFAVGLDVARASAVTPSDPARADSWNPGWLEQAWDAYKKRYVVDGRVIDNVNRISHSEGQGYAMLIAVKAGDRDGFDAIWTWTRRELMIRPDGLVAWKWDERANPRVSDPNNATDGDLLIAWALIEAAERWSDGSYTDAARAIRAAIGREALVRTPFGLALLPGRAGFNAADQPDGPVLNLSYWVFPAFDRLKGLAPEIAWEDLKATGLRLLRNSRFGPVRLPSDWVAIGSGQPAPAQGFQPRFSYNAIRIPLYLVWGGYSQPQYLRAYVGLWNQDANLGPFEIDVTSGAALDTLGGAGFKVIASLATCALEGRKLPIALRTVRMENYYPTTLHILSLIALQERYPQCL
jgi:endoglucanase